MRGFTEKEKLFLKRLVKLKENNNLQELQLMRILREQLDSLAISWEVEPKCSIQIFFQEKTPSQKQWNEIRKTYFEIADYIYLIEELLEYRLIKLQEISLDGSSFDNRRYLYNREKYEIHEDIIFEKENRENCLYALTDITKHKVNVTFARDLEKYANKIIYPLPLLNDLIDNKFQSINERRHSQQLCRTNISIIVASLAILIPIIYECFFDDKITKSDVNEIVTEIKELKSNISLDNKTQEFDTLELKLLTPRMPSNKIDTSAKNMSISVSSKSKQEALNAKN